MPKPAKTNRVSLADVRAYLRQAEEYLAAAHDGLKLKRYNAATSAAVHAGINATDAICGAALGIRSTSPDHAAALDLLSQAGAEGRKAAASLRRLIPVKSQAEYDPSPVSRSRAAAATRAAERILEIARRVILE